MRNVCTVSCVILVALLAASVETLAQSTRNGQRDAREFVEQLGNRIPGWLQDFMVPGAALAVIEDGAVILQQGYGFADVDKQVKVTTTTGFNIGSVSKTVAAWGVMKLVHDGVLDLDAPAGAYLSRWDFPESQFDSEEVTIRRLLSHTAGLSLHGYPGWSPNDELPTLEQSLNGRNNGPGRVEIMLEPGTAWRYSGGGFTVLQLIVEEVTGQTFESYMQAEILDPLGMLDSSYKIDDRIMVSSASGHDHYGEPIEFELFTAQAAAGLHTTLEDFTRFALASLNQDESHEDGSAILSVKVIREMMEPVQEIQGPYSYGLGYQLESIPGTSLLLAGHLGANSGWNATFVISPATQDGFVLLTNGGGGFRVGDQVYCDWVSWKTGVSPESRCGRMPPIAAQLKATIDRDGTANLVEVYAELRDKQPDRFDFSESQLNGLGYHYLARGNVESALAVFLLNIEAFPNSGNVYDSFGEALLVHGDRELAIENYTKSVELDPTNQGGIEILNSLGVDTSNLIKKAPLEYLELLAGEYQVTNAPQGMSGWTILFEVVEEDLVGTDGDYRYTLVWFGGEEFGIPDDPASVEFNTDDRDAITMVLFGEVVFEKVGD